MADQGESVTFILPSGEKQEFLIPSGMSDAEAKTYVLSKRPDLFQAKAPSFLDSANQAKQQLMSKMGQQMKPSALGGSLPMTPQQEQYINERLPLVNQRAADIRKAALTMAGASFGGGAVPGTGVFPSALRALSAGAGASVGNVAGQALGGNVPDPNEALKTGATTAGLELGGEALFGGAAKLTKWIGASKSFGAKMLQAASTKAGNAPVELSPETNAIIDDVVRQSKLGGRAPKVVSDLLERLGPSTKQAADAVPGPLTYDEARIVQGNLSTMSVNEINDLKGQLKYLMPKLARSFSQDVQAAAEKAGVGSEHALGMQEYATASARNRFLKNVVKVGAAGTGTYAALKGIQNLTK